MRLAAAALACAAMLASTATAQAAQRYASPAGTGEACVQLAPCSLETAVEKANANDEVIVGPGTYMLLKPLQTPLGVAGTGIDIHGAYGGPPPKIFASTSMEWALEFRGHGVRLAHLTVEDTAPLFAWGVKCVDGGVVEQVTVTVTGDPSIGLNQVEDCTVRDSLVLAHGSVSQGILATGGKTEVQGVARNVTSVATGSGSFGITSSFSFIGVPGGYTLDARNVIASGEGADLHTAGGSFGVGHFAISNSNFETVEFMEGSTITGSANQTAAPLFVDAAKGDYREAPGSPTIDAGAADPQIGTADLDGNPRTSGAAPDIGAYEFPSPAASSQQVAAGQIQSLAVAPGAFRAGGSGSAILSAKKKKAPVGATVSYSLSGAATTDFEVERKSFGRRAGGKCVRKTAANAAKKKCALFKAMGGSFTHSGVTGQNRFKFSGRVGNRALRPGSYRLVGNAGGAVKHASFRIVK